MKTDNAIVIRLTKLTETSLIVTWVTEENGLVKTVAKGARRPKSSFSGKLDIFYSASICWSESKSSELHHLREVSPENYREELRKSYPNMELAAYFSALLETVLEPYGQADGFHSLLQRGLDYLCHSPANQKALAHFEKESAKLLGLYSKQHQSHIIIESNFGILPQNRQRCIALLPN